MPKEYEYHEGKKAREHFEQGMKALFQVPKDAGEKKPARKRAKNVAKKTNESDVAPHVCR